MTEYEDEYVDPDAQAWEELRAENSVDYDWQLAQAAAAQVAQETSRQQQVQEVASEAAQMILTAQQANAEAERLSSAAALADRSMLAQYGSEYDRSRNYIARAIESDHNLMAGIDPANAQEVADRLEMIHKKLAPVTHPDYRAWSRIKDSGEKSYWQNIEGRAILDELQSGRG